MYINLGSFFVAAFRWMCEVMKSDDASLSSTKTVIIIDTRARTYTPDVLHFDDRFLSEHENRLKLIECNIAIENLNIEIRTDASAYL